VKPMLKNKSIVMEQSVVQIKGNIVSDMGGEKVMLSVDKGKYYNLGVIGGEIWGLLEKKISICQLVNTLISTYSVEKSECVKQVFSFLECLLDEGLIEITD
jgi:hypothetical protein